MSSLGRNDPCPCGSGGKVKKCHPGGAARSGWGLDGAGFPAAAGPRADPAPPPTAHAPAVEDAHEEDRGDEVEQAAAPPPPGPEGLRISREILDADLARGDLRAILVALNARLRAHRAMEVARAQALVRVGMRVGFRDRSGYREGLVREVRRTRVVVTVDGEHWLVPVTAVRPLEPADRGAPAASR